MPAFATGATLATVTIAVSVPVWATESVTVSVTVKTPLLRNVCDGVAPVDAADPSPQFHEYDAIAPSESLLPVPLKERELPSFDERSAPALATGGLSLTSTTTVSVAVLPT